MFLLQFIVSLFSSFVPLVGSINNQAFPNPLTPEEEEHYLTLMAQGDREAREKLIEHNLRLVAHIVKKYQNQTDDKEGNEICLIDVVRDEDKDLNDIIIQQLAIEKIEKNLKSLTQRERDIIVRRFGLENHEEETQQEIAKSYGISRSYVSRIEKRALMKLYRDFIKN